MNTEVQTKERDAILVLEVREHSMEMVVFGPIDYREPEYRGGELRLVHHNSLHQDIVIVVPRAIIA